MAVPTITLVSSDGGTTPDGGGIDTGGTTVTIQGLNFQTPNVTSVTFGGTSASFVIDNDLQITATSPNKSGTTGFVEVNVTNADGTNANTGKNWFYYVAQPTISSLSFSTGTDQGQEDLEITGTGFIPWRQPKVLFDSFEAIGVYAPNATTIIVSTPSELDVGSSTPTIKVKVDDAESTGTGFTFSSTKPAVFVMDRHGDTTTGGTSFQLTGTGFTGATDVKFGTQSGTIDSVDSDSVMQVSPPTSGVASARVQVTVTTPSGTSNASSATPSSEVSAEEFGGYGITTFDFSDGTPSITSLNFSSFPRQNGVILVVTGTDFLGAFDSTTAVRFDTGGTPVATTVWRVVDDTTIICDYIDSGSSAGSKTMTITNPSGTSSTFAYTDLDNNKLFNGSEWSASTDIEEFNTANTDYFVFDNTSTKERLKIDDWTGSSNLCTNYGQNQSVAVDFSNFNLNESQKRFANFSDTGVSQGAAIEVSYLDGPANSKAKIGLHINTGAVPETPPTDQTYSENTYWASFTTVDIYSKRTVFLNFDSPEVRSGFYSSGAVQNKAFCSNIGIDIQDGGGSSSLSGRLLFEFRQVGA